MREVVRVWLCRRTFGVGHGSVPRSDGRHGADSGAAWTRGSTSTTERTGDAITRYAVWVVIAKNGCSLSLLCSQFAQMRQTMRMTAQRSVAWSKNFAQISALFAGTECVIEKYRGKHDVWNTVLSGCAAGAILGAPQGPQVRRIDHSLRSFDYVCEC